MATSYNGWPADPDPDAIGVTSFGDAAGYPFPGGVRGGDVATVLGYVATQLHYRVEPCVNGWCWGYTYKANVNNPSQLSCHASATAIDWNAPDHPNGSGGTFTDDQVGTIYTILNEVQGAVSWLAGYDEMHFEICVDAGTLAGVAASLAGTTPPPPTDGWDDMTPEDVENAMRNALAGIAEDTGECRRMLGVLVGYPPAAGETAAAGMDQSIVLGELRRLIGVLVGYPPAGPPEANLYTQLNPPE